MNPAPGRWSLLAANVRALVRKDLRSVLPLVLGLGTLWLFGVLEQALFEPPSAATWVEADTWSNSTAIAFTLICLITAILAALVLLAGERDARTAEFVATLPVDPLVVVGCKFLVIATLTVAVLWMDLLADSGLATLINPEPTARRALTASSFVWRFGMQGLLALICAAHALWLSSYGRLGWVILALATFSTLVLAELSPLLAPVRIGGLLHLSHHGTTPQFPWRAFWFHGGLGAVTLVAGTRRWVRAHGVPPRQAVVEGDEQPRPSRLGPAFLLVGLMLVVGVIVIFVRQHSEDQAEQQRRDPDQVAPVATDQVQTRHFTFTFLPGDSAIAHALAEESEALYRQAARFTGTEVPERIIADLTFAGVEAAGLALGYHLTVDVSGGRHLDELRPIFLHELVHTFETALAPRARLEQRASLRFLAEGFAEYVTFELLQRGHERQRGRLQAAWARKRYKLHLRDLFDSGRFVASYDERWLYDFGERWMAALAATCGRAAPRRMFARLGEPGLPATLLGADLARHLLARDRCDYDQVESAFEADLGAAEPALAEVPRFRARFQDRSSSTFVFDVLVDGKPGRPVPVTLILRADVTTSPRAFVVEEQELQAGAVQRIKVDAPALDDRSFQYRVGIDVTNGGRYFTRWRSARTE